MFHPEHEPFKESACLAVSNFGEILVGNSEGGLFVFESIHLLQYKNNLNYAVWGRHKKTVHTCVFSKDGANMITGSQDGTLCIWNWYKDIQISEEPTPKAIISYEAISVIGFNLELSQRHQMLDSQLFQSRQLCHCGLRQAQPETKGIR